jgi:hypothetical protein
MARKLTELELLEELRTVECELSPENLHCDGEITLAAAKRKKKRLNARRAQLVKQLGREPTEHELWN